VKALLRAINSKLLKSVDYFNAKSMSMAMMGLSEMTSESPEVCNLLTTLASRMDTLDSQVYIYIYIYVYMYMYIYIFIYVYIYIYVYKLDSQACGNILYSMKKMDSKNSAVRGFLNVLAPKIESCIDVMSGQELANAFYGLQGKKC
jgi:hypothetical protein